MCAMVNLDDSYRDKLKDYAERHGLSMIAVLRHALDQFFACPTEVTPTADARARGAWYVVALIWQDESLVRTLRATVASTGELPALAERACSEAGAPADGIAGYVRAELSRFRQNLARVHSSSLRVRNGDWLCQLDVYRDQTEGWTPLTS
jgi:plasmid stability protein